MATKTKNRRERRAELSRKRRGTSTGINRDILKIAGLSIKADAMPNSDGDDEEDEEDGDFEPDMDDAAEGDLMSALGLESDDEDPGAYPTDEEDDEDEKGFGDPDDIGQNETGQLVEDGVASLSADQLDSLIDQALGIGDDEEEDAEEKRAKAAARKKAAAMKVLAAVKKSLESVNLPADVKNTLIKVAVREKLAEAEARAAKKTALVVRQRKAVKSRMVNERKALDGLVSSIVEEKLMNTRTGRGFSFGGYAGGAPERKGMGANTRYMGGQAPAFNRSRRGAEFKLVDVVRSIHDMDFRQQYMKEFKALGGATGAAGGYIVPEQWTDDFIRLLRAKAVIRGLARVIPMQNDTLHYPKQTGAATANWVGENSDVSTGAVDQSFAEIVFTAHKLAVFSTASNELLMDSPYNAEKIIRDDLLYVAKLKEDYSFMFGSGTGAEPSGIYTQTPSGNILVGSGSSNALVADDLYRVMNKVERNNAKLDVWIVNASGLQAIRTLKDTTGNYIFSAYEGYNAPQPVVEAPFGEDPEDYNTPVGKVLGRDVYIENQIPDTVAITTGAVSGLTGGTNTLIMGGERRQLMIGQRMQLEIAASNVAGSSFQNDQTYFRAILREDFKLGISGAWAMCAFPTPA